VRTTAPSDGGRPTLSLFAAALRRAARRDGKVIVHFGVLPDAEGWCAAEAARPDEELLGQVRPLYSR
jgi:hypothetical protein